MENFDKIGALEYLVKNSVYSEEWSGAGMYEAVQKIIESEDETFTQYYLDDLLNYASNF